MQHIKYNSLLVMGICFFTFSFAQKMEMVKLVTEKSGKAVSVFIGNKPFTVFLYPDSLEKPVLYPLRTAGGTIVTRGYPLSTRPGDPNDHPHHVGLWLNFENVNGLDFWNNSFAIAADKKHLYGWIKTDQILQMSDGAKGILVYHATHFEFSGNVHIRIIDRTTILKANTDVLFKDAKDGFLGLRLAHELQIPSKQDQEFTDDKGNITVVKGGTDNLASGNYITSEGKQGDEAWSTRASWCKVYGKMGKDSVSITIIDHPQNINYPTYWHARGYGLFAANPLAATIFSNGKHTTNLQLKKGESVTLRFRIVIDEDKQTLSAAQLDKLAEGFAK
jgi:Methane oxygenase PmoA